LTEIYLCHACFYHKIEDANGPDTGAGDHHFYFVMGLIEVRGRYIADDASPPCPADSSRCPGAPAAQRLFDR
jgi:hypothetical protein